MEQRQHAFAQGVTYEKISLGIAEFMVAVPRVG